MTSATTTPARGMSGGHAGGYGLIVFASVLVPDDHRGRRSRAMWPVHFWQQRESGCLTSLCVDRPQLAGMVTCAICEFRDEFRLWWHLLVPATVVVLFLFPLYVISIGVWSRYLPQAEENKHDKRRLLVLSGAAWRA